MTLAWQIVVTTLGILAGALYCLLCFRLVFWLFRKLSRKLPRLIPELLLLSGLISVSMTVAVAKELYIALGP